LDSVNVQQRMIDHEERIKTLEHNYNRLEGKITTIENGQLQLENTVLKTSQENKDLLTKLIDHHFDLSKTKLIGRKEIIIAVLGGGGIAGIVITIIANYI
jgi:hypothetical protein